MLNKKLLGGSSGLPQDDNFENVTLLLNGDGTNGGQNNTFVDSSTNNFTITRNGNTTQGSFSPYGDLWSNYFNGSTDWFTTASSSAFAFGTGAFTMEAWIFPTASQTDNWIIGLANNCWLRIGSSGKLEFYDAVANSGTLSANAVSLNTWSHVAAVRSGTTLTLYINGSSAATSTVSSNFSTNVACTIGNQSGQSRYWNGYISNARVVKGTAVYTSTFTPSLTPLTAITNTSILTCQSNRFIDNSSNAFALTINGSPSVQRFSPFEPSAPYSTSVIGGSGYFDGSGDYLVAGTSSNLALGSGNFTVDGWYYLIAAGGGAAIYSGINTYPSSTGLILYVDSGNVIRVDCNGTILSAGSSPVNQWVYFSLVRSGSTITLYINSSSAGTATLSTNLTDQYVVLGRTGAGTSSNLFNGYLANIRVTPGTAIVPTSNPTSLNSSVSGTQFLANFTNASIFDYAMMNNLETVGNAQVSTSVKKYGTGSLAFDGTGDYLFQDNQIGYPTNASFTLECWVYFNSSGNYGIITKGGGSGSWSATNGHQFLLFVESGTLYWMWNNSGSNTQIQTSAPSNTTWHHLAIGYNGTTTRFWLNGTSVGTSTTGYTLPTTRNRFVIGALPDYTYVMNGYIDDVRFTQGVDRYGVGNSSITVPASAHPTF